MNLFTFSIGVFVGIVCSLTVMIIVKDNIAQIYKNAIRNYIENDIDVMIIKKEKELKKLREMRVKNNE